MTVHNLRARWLVDAGEDLRQLTASEEDELVELMTSNVQVAFNQFCSAVYFLIRETRRYPLKRPVFALRLLVSRVVNVLNPKIAYAILWSGVTHLIDEKESELYGS